MKAKLSILVVLVTVGSVATGQAQVSPTVRLQINVDDRQGTPSPCRVHLTDGAGKPLRAPGQPFWRDHFVCAGRVAIDLKPGK